MAGSILALAAVATLLGADAARRPLEPREIGEDTLRRALVSGTSDPEVRERLVELRTILGRRPLDSLTRAVYASLLLSMSRDADELATALFHARRAVQLAPVTLPVVRIGVLALAHTGQVREAAALVRGAFAYDAPAAASLLSRIEPLLLETPIDEALPAEPGAWLAWAIQLDLAGRHAEALERLEEGVRRWPDDLPLLDRLALRLAQRGDWQALAALLSPERVLPDERRAAGLWIQRALFRARAGDVDGAAADAERALGLDPRNALIRIRAAEAFLVAGHPDRARHEWTAALFDLGAAETATRGHVLERLARLEDEHGSPAAALRAWRALAELDPAHPEARRRIDDLDGFHRGR